MKSKSYVGDSTGYADESRLYWVGKNTFGMNGLWRDQKGSDYST